MPVQNHANSGPPKNNEKMKGCAVVVDDDPRLRTFVKNVLAGARFDSRELSQLSELEALLANERPEIIILDLSLGSSDAIEAIRSLATARYTGKVLLISGHDPATIDEVNKIGLRHGLAMLPYLHKPFRVAELRERLDSAAAVAPVSVEHLVEFALQESWLELWYQPKIHLGSKLLCGAEALLRLRHPDRGVLLPRDFLPAPGDLLYEPLTDFVVRRAISDWMLLAERGITHRLAINVPASILQSPKFVSSIRRHLPNHPKFPGLIVEITEDEAIGNPELAREISVQLKLYNVHVSIDDFGAGYSSLARLGELPFAELKLDRRFVSGCASDERKRLMCKSVVELAQKSNILTVAEGIERTEDLEVLTELGYDMAQGFLFAKPMDIDSFRQSVATHARLNGFRPSAG
jgi:EAL domain-containing protein (putative c-di-GMP-specific phosphodiesterase class I)/CheY-like chemotaxis protein